MSKPLGQNLKNGPKNGIDARRTPRRVFRRPVGLLVAGHYKLVQGLQLSEGGMLVGLDQQKLEVGTSVVATFVIPSGPVIVARGEVIYENVASKGVTQIGIKFETLPIQERRVVRHYISAKTLEEAQWDIEIREHAQQASAKIKRA